jgi:hypothetical protein
MPAKFGPRPLQSNAAARVTTGAWAHQFLLFLQATSLLFTALLLTALLLAAPLLAVLLACSSLTADDDLAGRREKLSQLTASQRQQLLRKQQRFAALDSDQRQRLRQLQKQLESDPQGPRLHKVLDAYYDWLKTLTTSERAELVDLPAKERVEQIKKLRRQQAARVIASGEPGLLTPDDLKTVGRWMEEVVWSHRDQLLKTIPPPRRKQLANMPEAQRRRVLLMASWQRWRAGEAPPISPAEIKRLVEQLSAPAQQRFAQVTDPPQQRRLVKEWVRLSVHDRVERARKLDPIARDELERFLWEELNSKQRDRLLNLPNEQMQQELRRLYFQKKAE